VESEGVEGESDEEDEGGGKGERRVRVIFGLEEGRIRVSVRVWVRLIRRLRVVMRRRVRVKRKNK
jgi:hypothetical protein